MCSIYYGDLRILVEEYELEMRDNSSMKVDFMSSDPYYSVQRDQYDHHPDYGLFGSIIMKGLTEFLREVFKPRAHPHLSAPLQNSPSGTWFVL